MFWEAVMVVQAHTKTVSDRTNQYLQKPIAHSSNGQVDSIDGPKEFHHIWTSSGASVLYKRGFYSDSAGKFKQLPSPRHTVSEPCVCAASPASAGRRPVRFQHLCPGWTTNIQVDLDKFYHLKQNVNVERLSRHWTQFPSLIIWYNVAEIPSIVISPVCPFGSEP